ncbi:MAG: alkaline phosphatase [Bacteroidota bacterium]
MLRLFLILFTAVLLAFPVLGESEGDQNSPIKYIFYFIGDGVASPQISVTQALISSGAVPDIDKEYKLSLFDLPVTGSANTSAEDRFITGSAAAATALATGYKTTINTIAKTGDRRRDLKTIAEMAKDRGMKVGILSSVSIDHATPACFYAHADERSQYFQIAEQMARSNFDFFGGGFAKGDAEKYGNSNKILPIMKKAGYTICTNRKELSTVDKSQKVWAYTEYDQDYALNYEIDRKDSEISLSEFTQKAIDHLGGKDGFFIMVEAGKIDWACHANDVVTAVYDMIEFDRSIAKALEFYNDKEDSTLIVVTGDHECGGLTIGHAETKYANAFNILVNQKISFLGFSEKIKNWSNPGSGSVLSFEDVADSITYYFGLHLPEGVEDKSALSLNKNEISKLKKAYDKSFGVDTAEQNNDYLLYGGYEPLSVTVTHILNNKAGLDWTSYKHTALPVPVYAIGPGSVIFTGTYENNEVARKMMKITGLNQ